MSFEFYKVLHLAGVFLVLMGFGALILNAVAGGGKQAPWRKASIISHGVGLLLALVGGFGLLARMGIVKEWPAWVTVKVVIWVALGALVAVVGRMPGAARAMWFVVLALAIAAAWLGGVKPF